MALRLAEPGDGVRISLDELRALQERGEPVVLVDVRRDATYDEPTRLQGAIRLSPEVPARDAARLDLPREAWIVPYCT